MSDVKELIDQLSKVANPKYLYNQKDFEPGKSQLLYSGPFWDEDEIKMGLEAFLTGSWATTGEYVFRFQNVFAKHFGVKYAHMVNSGSSANLILVTALKKHLDWKDGDEIIVSPVGFPTTIAPIVQNNLKPVFADIELNTLNFDLDQVAAKINDRTVAIFVSPVLGNPPDMYKLVDMVVKENHRRMKKCTDNGDSGFTEMRLIGDNCDSLGSKWDGRYLTDYYYAWTTSFYPAHHITTIEGGMVCSNNDDLNNLVRSFSWWGRDCRCVGKANLLPCGTCGNRFSDWLGDGQVIDHKYVFTNMGYNLKPIDMQGAIGLAQMRKIDTIERLRRENYKLIANIFSNHFSKRILRVVGPLELGDPCWFGVPFYCQNNDFRAQLVNYLEKHKIQTRSYFAGNLLKHPGYKHLDDANNYPNSNKALSNVFFLGCPPHYGKAQMDYIEETLRNFLEAEPCLVL